jgi:guanylate kinase
VLLDIDVQGWQQVRRLCPDAVSVFVRASSLEEYEKRLRSRATESEAQVRRRLQAARAELAHADDYDHQIINDDLHAAQDALRAIIRPLFEREDGCSTN